MKSRANLVDVFRDSIIFRLISFIIILTTVFGFIIYKLEPKYFSTWLDGIWWSLVTIFTVGYGDYVPHTSLGKLLGILLILLGTGFCSYYMVLFATEMISKQYMKIKGEDAATCHGHMIIVGWNERAKQVASQMHVLEPNLNIVLIDETLSLLPKPFHHLEFIKGCPHHDQTLLKANIKTAHTILITADKEKNESLADTQSILNILTAKGLNPNIHCIAELLTSEQIQNATRAGANEIIEGNKLTSYVFTASLLFPSISGVLFTLYNEISESRLQLMNTPSSYIGKTFEVCSSSLLKQDILLLGVQRNEQYHINPVHSFVIIESDVFILIKH
ncbi:potassium channel protein [Bacillus pseudomycoides]|uniref:Potassium channel protein n=1 Tax=Bacillus pseudomycoides TaxID=64104 RepID=A0AA91ZSR1_9BACI|nr:MULTISPECIES: potassium channel family protein [Bacillus]PEB50549.1 potassium channel protein [Bacillus sp. AFS098217]PED82001.1 potassium channel protein [Bacillus pseudomycoides]PEU05655.1 potassium channel protein [Bacillus sp. AFS019443]PEU10512.1 potassium channel protein [Bacillus sp. AFS014408]PFW61136.1 potassium channel protein [Bacillus sp. AFS075034]